MTGSSRWWVAGVLLGALGALSGTAAANGGEACSPEVQAGLRSWGQDGVHRAAAVIRDEEVGVSRPDSVFDFSCLSDLFRLPGIYVFGDPSAIIGSILRGLEDLVCDSAEALVATSLNRPIREMAFWEDAPYVPGVDVGARWRRKVSPPDVDVEPVTDIRASEGSYRDARWFRRAIGR